MAGRRGGNVRVSITADADGVKRGTRDAENSIDRLSRRGGAAFGRLGRAAAVGGAAVAGGLVLALKESADAAIEAEKAQARLNAQLDAIGKNTPKFRAQIDEAVTSLSNLSGFDDEDLQDSFVNIARVTGDVSKALDLNAIAADLARAKQIDVAKAGEIVGKVAGGNVGILSRYGIQLEKGATASEALAALQGKVAGQAKAFGETTAGSTERAKVAFENLGETIGAAVAPAIAAAAGAASTFINQLQTGEGAGGRFRDTVGAAFERVRAVATGVVSAFNSIRQSGAGMAGVGAVIGTIVAAFAATKILAFVAAVKAAGGALAALRANPVFLIAAALGAAAGALGLMKLKTDATRGSVEQLNAAFDRQRDALRALNDFDLEYAQRKANVRSANLAVKEAEERLADLRSGKVQGSALDVARAEDTLIQARINQRRAKRDLNRADEDGNAILAEAKNASQGATRTTRDRIKALRDEISELDKEIKRKKEAGEKTADLLKKQQALRQEISRLKSRSVEVDVEIVFNGRKIPPLKPLSELRGGGGSGDGWGIRRMIDGQATLAGRAAIEQGLIAAPAAGSGLNAFNAIARSFGLAIGSGIRPGARTKSGNLSYHALGRARDFPGPASAMLAFAKYLAGAFGSRLKELIYTPLGFSIKNGRRVAPYAQADHLDHVHVAMRRGGRVPGSGSGDRVPALLEPGEFVIRRKIVERFGPTFFAGINDVARFQAGGMVRAARSARKAGFAGTALKVALAVGAAESANYTDMTGDAHLGGSYGPWMIHHPSHPQYNIRRLQTDWDYAANAAWEVSKRGRDWSPWTMFRNGRFRRYLGEARRVAIGSGRGGGGSPGGGILPGGGVRVPGAAGDRGLPPNALAPTSYEGKTGIRVPGFGMGTQAEPLPESTAGDQPTAQDFGNRDLALAQLTETSDDDLAALRNLEGLAQQQLDAALLTADPRDDIEAANLLRGIRDQIKSLDDAAERQRQAEAERLQILKQLADELKRQNDFAQSVVAITGREAVRALADMISGEIVGRGVIPRAATAGHGSVAAF